MMPGRLRVNRESPLVDESAIMYTGGRSSVDTLLETERLTG